MSKWNQTFDSERNFKRTYQDSNSERNFIDRLKFPTFFFVRQIADVQMGSQVLFNSLASSFKVMALVFD